MLLFRYRCTVADQTGKLVLRHEIDNSLQRGILQFQQIGVFAGATLAAAVLVAMFGFPNLIPKPIDQGLLFIGLLLLLANIRPMLRSKAIIQDKVFVALDDVRGEFVLHQGQETRIPMNDIDQIVPYVLPSGAAPRAPQGTLLLKNGVRQDLPFMLIDGVDPIKFYTDILANMRQHLADRNPSA